MAALDRCQLPWLSDKVKADFHEATDRVTHYVEELDELHGRAEVAHDLIDSRLAQQLNRRMFLLSVLAGVILPPTLVTGLLGVNVGGLPGADSEWAFPVVCVVLLALAAVPLLVLRRLRWL